MLNTVPGAADVKVEQTEGFPTLDVQFDRDAIARYGLTVEDVTDTVAAAMGGREAGHRVRRRPALRHRRPPRPRNRATISTRSARCRCMLPGEGGAPGIGAAARAGHASASPKGLNQVSRENGKRRVVVQANVRGRDLGSFVAEAQDKVAAQVKLPPGSFIEWGGQFENLQAASQRLVAGRADHASLLIFGILFLALRSVRAVAGGLFGGAAWPWPAACSRWLLAGLPFSVSAAVGFIVLSGVTVLNGLVVMTSIRQRLDAGMAGRRGDRRRHDGAGARGADDRHRARRSASCRWRWRTGTGAEVQKPLATSSSAA